MSLMKVHGKHAGHDCVHKNATNDCVHIGHDCNLLLQLTRMLLMILHVKHAGHACALAYTDVYSIVHTS